MSSGHVHGGVITARLESVIDKHGRKEAKDILLEMKKRGYKGPMSPIDFKVAEFYPVDHILMFFEVYIERHGQEAFHAMSREAAKRKGIVGWFFSWAGTPEIALKKASKYWPQAYDFGELKGIVKNSNKGMLVGKNVSPKPLFCEALTHYYTGVMEGIKVANPRVEHTSCQHNGAKNCEWELQWDD